MIIVTVRARDEAHRIGQFCEAYKDADKILVADGGSEDDTSQKAPENHIMLLVKFQKFICSFLVYDKNIIIVRQTSKAHIFDFSYLMLYNIQRFITSKAVPYYSMPT